VQALGQMKEQTMNKANYVAGISFVVMAVAIVQGNNASLDDQDYIERVGRAAADWYRISEIAKVIFIGSIGYLLGRSSS